MKKMILPAVAALLINNGCQVQDTNDKEYEVGVVKPEKIEIEKVTRGTSIRVLVIIDNNTSVTNNDINKQFNTTNKVFGNSNLDIGFEKSLTIGYNSDISNTGNNLLQKITIDKEIQKLKRETNSQVAVLFSKGINDVCGIAWQNNYIEEKYTYAVINASCGNETMAHEIGHTLGLAHSIRQEDNIPKSYAHGYGVDGVFHTTMAYPQNYSTNNTLMRFSDSDREYEGFKTGNEGYANAVRAIRENIGKYKTFNQ